MTRRPDPLGARRERKCERRCRRHYGGGGDRPAPGGGGARGTGARAPPTGRLSAGPGQPAGAAIDRRILRRLLGLARPYWPLLAVGGVCLLISSALGLVLPWLIRTLVDGILIARDGELLRRVVIGLVAVLAVQAVFNFGQGYLLAYAGERLVADLRRRLYRHLQGLSVGFFDGRRVGELMSRLTNDVTAIQTSITTNLLTFFQQLVFLLGAATLVLITDWRLAAVALAVLPPIIAAGAFFGKRLQALANEQQAELGAATTVLEETIAGARTVKSFAREDYEVARYDASVGRTFATAMRRTRLRAVFSPLISLFVFLGLTGVLVFGAREVGQGRITPGELISSLIYLLMVAGPMGALTGVYAQLREASGAAERLFELLDTAPEVVDAPDARPLPARSPARWRSRGSSSATAARRRPLGAARPLARHRAGGDGGAGRAERRRQVDAGQPAAALLRPGRGTDHPRRPRHRG